MRGISKEEMKEEILWALEKATTEKTVDEIMDECGFTSRGEFFRKFRQNFGEPPIQFKKSQKSVQK